MPIRPFLLIFALAATAHAQTQPQPNPQPDATLPGGILTGPRAAEPVLDALTRTGPDTITLKLAANKLLVLHDFDFNGDPVPTGKIHLRQLAPGVFELTSLAYAPGIWRFNLTDTASYYGLGAHFDTLDHAHTIVRNRALDVPPPRGSTTPAPVPFFLSTTGYGLWLDAAAEPGKAADATFDLNASDPANITIDAATTRLRIVLFTGGGNCTGRFLSILDAFYNLTHMQPRDLPFDFDNLPGALTAVLSSSLSGQWFPGGVPMSPPDPPDRAKLSRWIEFLAFTSGGESFLPIKVPPYAVALEKRYNAIAGAFFNHVSRRKNLDPLVLDLQGDPDVRELHDEYLLGTDVLVAPALDANPTRLVYLPAGKWHNVFTGEQFTGPVTIVAPTPLDVIPVYARAGVVIKLPSAAPQPASESAGDKNP